MSAAFTTDASKFNAKAWWKKRAAILEAETGDPVEVRRRALTRNDPLAFALVYLRHHLKDEATGGRITFSDAHLEWAERAKEWINPPTEPEESRHADIAPRSTGKSTWKFLILPMWAAAHGHLKFIAAFADSADQAELHLATFKHELESNVLLRADFPDLCTPLVRGRGVVASDNRGLYLAANDFAFMAKGIESSTLGMKIGERRPDMLLLDDIEPGESKYSSAMMKKRLSTLLDVILPISFMARVEIVGTVTMAGSIIHQLTKAAAGSELSKDEEWITTNKIKAHHFHPIITTDDGGERSIWPAKWPMEYLERNRHTRSFAKNFANDPMGAEGDYWTGDDFIREELPGITRTMLSVDPAVTSKDSSDFTGLAIVGYSPSARKVRVSYARAVKLAPAMLRRQILRLCEENPEIGLIYIEVNQGGDTWKEILHSMPVPVKTVHQSVKKEVRAASVLNRYQQGRVYHARWLAALEEQMVAFPDAPHDDLVDAVGTAVAYFLRPKKRTTGGSRSESYLD
jgi:predicted phage terminase large subunit-like protein